MDKKTVFVKTTKGDNEVKGKGGSLSGDLKRALLLVDDTSTFDEVSRRSAPSLRSLLPEVFGQLIAGGYIRDRAKPFAEAQFAVPKATTPESGSSDDELDFTSLPGARAKKSNENDAARSHAEVEAVVEAAKLKAKAEADAKAQASAKQAAEAEARNKLEAEARAKQDAVLRAQAEARAKIEAEARALAEQAAVQAKLQLEAAAKAKAEAEERARQEIEAIRLKAEQEAARAKAELEAAAKARAEAEAARIKAEQLAIQIKIEQEAARAKLEAEAKALAQERAKQEIEAARLKAEQEAARKKAEQEAAKIKAEAVAKAFAEERAKQEAEAARIKAVQEAAKAKAQAEAVAKELAAEKAKQEAEAARIKAEEAAAKVKAESEARALAEERARQEAEAAQIKAEQEAAKVKAESEARALADERARQEAEAARIKADQEAAKIKAESEARALADERARQEAAKTKAESEARALADDRARQEVEAVRIKAAQEAEQSRVELEAAKAKAEAEAKALAEERVRQEAARVKAEQEAALIRAELEAAKAKAQAEARALAEQRTRQEAESARIKAEQEAARIHAEQEASRKLAEPFKWVMSEPAPEPEPVHSIEFHQKVKDERLEAERILLEHKIAEQEAAMLKANEDSQKLADEQAKTWAAAEQRANVHARVEASRHVETVGEPVKVNVQQSVRVRRRPIPVGKIVAGLVVVLLLSIWFVPLLMPLDDYIAPIEKKLSDQFKQPVHIGAMHAELLPLPKLQLQKVSIGVGQELKMGDVILIFDPFSLFSPVKNIRNVEIKDVNLDGASLEKESVWLQEIGANSGFKFSHIAVQHIKISSAEITLPVSSGDLEITGQGRIGKVTFKSEDGKFDLTIQSAQDRWQLTMNAKGATLPMFPNLLLDDFTANGDIGVTGVNFADIDAQAYGGFLHGNAKLTWQKGWQVQGRIGAKSVELDKLFPKFGISGELLGDCNFSSSGSKLGLITDVEQLDGSFTINKGVVNNMDIVETVRQGDRQLGRTHFDELTGNFQSNGRGQHFQLLRMSSGILSGSGTFDVAAESKLTGRLSVELKSRAGASALSLSGTLAEPVLRPGR